MLTIEKCSLSMLTQLTLHFSSPPKTKIPFFTKPQLSLDEANTRFIQFKVRGHLYVTSRILGDFLTPSPKVKVHLNYCKQITKLMAGWSINNLGCSIISYFQICQKYNSSKVCPSSSFSVLFAVSIKLSVSLSVLSAVNTKFS